MSLWLPQRSTPAPLPDPESSPHPQNSDLMNSHNTQATQPIRIPHPPCNLSTLTFCVEESDNTKKRQSLPQTMRAAPSIQDNRSKAPRTDRAINIHLKPRDLYPSILTPPMTGEFVQMQRRDSGTTFRTSVIAICESQPWEKFKGKQACQSQFLKASL